MLQGIGPRVLWLGVGGTIFLGVLESTKRMLKQRPPKLHQDSKDDWLSNEPRSVCFCVSLHLFSSTSIRIGCCSGEENKTGWEPSIQAAELHCFWLGSKKEKEKSNWVQPFSSTGFGNLLKLKLSINSESHNVLSYYLYLCLGFIFFIF